MAIRSLPEPDLLRKLIEYRPETGELIWRPRTPEMFVEGRRAREHVCAAWNTKNAGKPAFNHMHGKHHLAGTLLGAVHLAHRVAWAVHYGVSAFGVIDHIDGDGTNNRITNLRLASKEINQQNAHQRHDCSSGVTGVHWHVNRRWGNPHWVARIQCGKRRIFLGSFETFDEAVAARRAAEKKYGFGPTHGKLRHGK